MIGALALLLLSAAGPSRHRIAPRTDSIPVKNCGDPKVPIGLLSTASGTVQLTLARNGRPDTASIAVTEVTGMSAAGFRSVAVRKLGACRFDVGKVAGNAGVQVRAAMQVGGATITLGPAVPSPEPAPALALTALDLPIDSFPLPYQDARVEEHPRRLRCNDPPMPSAGSPQQMRERMREWSATWMGIIHARVNVGVNGTPERRVLVLDSSNSDATSNLVNLLLGCSYVPGRTHGVVVPTYMIDSIGVVTGGRP